MVSWEKTFVTAGKIVFIVIAWYSIGIGTSVGLIVLMGDLTIQSALSNPTALLNLTNLFQQLSEFIANAVIAGMIGVSVAALSAVAIVPKYFQ